MLVSGEILLKRSLNTVVQLKDKSSLFQPGIFPFNVAIAPLWVMLNLHSPTVI